MASIHIDNLSFSYTSQPLLNGITMHVGDGERACLVGPNGCGKSTLLRLVAGALRPDSGTVSIDGQAPTSKAPASKAPADPATFTGTVTEYLDTALASIRALLYRFEELTQALANHTDSPALVTEYDQLLAHLTTADAWSLDAKVSETLGGLDLGPFTTPPGANRHLHTLSPGQRARLALAATLLVRPPVLVLDEPTNHLDAPATDYLVSLLRDWPGPVLMTSHDRAFIEATATVTYDLDIAAWQALATARGEGTLPGVYACAGSYSDYVEAKAQARESHTHIHAAQQAQKRALTAHRNASQGIARGGTHLKTAKGMAKKFYSDRAATTATRSTRNDDRKLEALADREVRKPRGYDLHLELPQVPARMGLAVSARAAGVPGRLAPVTFDLSYGEHLLVTGPNGAGKSTLLTWLATGVGPTGAEVVGSLDCDLGHGWVPQRLPRLGDAGFDTRVWERGVGELGRGIMHPSLWATPIAELSHGNQRRAQLAVAVATGPEVLVIDEPTNYLDLDSMEMLETALAGWAGTVIVSSHDRWLIDHWQGRRLELKPV